MSSGFNFNSRQLAASEVISDVLHTYGSEILLHIAFTKSDFILKEEDFRKALVLLSDFQPALRMRIVTENKKKLGITKRFVETRHFEPDITVKKGLNKDSWLPIAEQELSTGFNAEEGPLWKVTFLDLSESPDPSSEGNGTLPNGHTEFDDTSSSDYGYVKFQKKKGRVHFKEEYEGILLFKVHHVLADGVSMFNVIHRQLLPLIHKVITKGSIEGFGTPLSMLPGVDESFLPKGGDITRANSLQRRTSSLKKRKRHRSSSSTKSTQALFTPLLFEGLEVEPLSTSANFLLPVTIGRSASKEILEKCMENNLPIHSVLVTAASVAFSLLTQFEGLDLSSEVVCGLPVDLREYRTIKGYQPLGKWLGYGTVNVKSRTDPIGPEQFWQEVKKVYEKTASEKPWKNFEVYQEAINSFIRTEGDVSFAAELNRPHFELYDLGCCDDLEHELSGKLFHFRQNNCEKIP